jgi:hypothetical protein
MPLDVMALARRVGESEYKTPGRIFMPELEAIFLLRCTRRSVYDGGGGGRLRRHGLVVAMPDATKSTIASTLLTKLCGAVPYELRHEGGNAGRPTFVELQGGVTYEFLRGGYQDGTFVPPKLHDVDFLYASEFFSFFGHSPREMLTKADQFNVALEEGRLVVGHKAAFGATVKEVVRFKQESVDKGFHFDTETRTISYNCGASFIGCTRPFTPTQWQALDSCGFLGRCAITQWDPNDKEAFDYYGNQFGIPDAGGAAALRAFNDFAWNAKFHRVEPPPLDMVDRCVRLLNEDYLRIGRRTGRSFIATRPIRDRQNITQLIVVSAILRHLTALYERDPSAQAVIPNLTYERSDEKFVLAHYDYTLKSIERRAESSGPSDPALEESIGLLTDFVRALGADKKRDPPFRDAREEANYHDEESQDRYPPQRFERFLSSEFTAFLKKKLDIVQTSANRRIRRLRDTGYISEIGSKGRNIIYQVASHIVDEAGFKSTETLMDEDDPIGERDHHEDHPDRSDPILYEPPIEE